MEATKTFEVVGMTCDHCRTSVIEEVSEVAGVERVEVDLDSGALQVQGNIAPQSVAAAVAEAGYQLAGEDR
jgi:copper chaperone CopZ